MNDNALDGIIMRKSRKVAFYIIHYDAKCQTVNVILKPLPIETK